jgi:probable blue pigment (indigoidine) exporter
MRQALLTAIAPALWGTTYIVATELLPHDRPLLVATMRALPVGLLLVAWHRRLPEGRWWWRAFALGALNIGLFFALLFFAAFRLPGGVAATIGAVQPLLVAALAWPLLGDRPTRRVLTAGVAGLVGVGLVVLGPAARVDGLGVAAALAATALMALGTLFGKRWGRPVPLLLFTGWQLAAGGLILLPIAALVEGPPPALTSTNIAGFVYLGLVNTGLAYALWFRGIGRLRAAQLPFLGLLSPLVAVAAGWVILGQPLSGVQLAGALLVLASIIWAQRSGSRADTEQRERLAQASIAPRFREIL